MRKIILFFIGLYLYLFFFNIVFNFKFQKNILIEIDTSYSKKKKVGGPAAFVKGIKDILPFKTSNCLFLESENIYSNKKIDEYDLLYVPIARFKESYFKKWAKIRESNKLILGPIFVPKAWDAFPNKRIWYERKFKEILGQIKGIVIHSNQVRNHLILNSNTIDMFHKYKVVRACTNLKPKLIKPFNDRSIDILFFEKFKRLNRTKQAIQLINIFRNYSTFNIVELKYGKYKTEDMELLANDSKFIIYFSFYDTGAIGLKEIQNFGVYTFTHQKEFVIIFFFVEIMINWLFFLIYIKLKAFNKETSFYIPELTNIDEMFSSFKKIIKIIYKILLSKPNSELIAQKNQEINKCKNALKDLCDSL